MSRPLLVGVTSHMEPLDETEHEEALCLAQAVQEYIALGTLEANTFMFLHDNDLLGPFEEMLTRLGETAPYGYTTEVQYPGDTEGEAEWLQRIDAAIDEVQ